MLIFAAIEYNEKHVKANNPDVPELTPPALRLLCMLCCSNDYDLSSTHNPNAFQVNFPAMNFLTVQFTDDKYFLYAYVYFWYERMEIKVVSAEENAMEDGTDNSSKKIVVDGLTQGEVDSLFRVVTTPAILLVIFLVEFSRLKNFVDFKQCFRGRH